MHMPSTASKTAFFMGAFVGIMALFLTMVDAQRDVQLTEYAEAYHAFDSHTLTAPMHLPQAQTARHCRWEEQSAGQIINSQTKQPFSYDDSCIERGVTVAYNAQAYSAALKAVKEVLTVMFKLQ